MAEDRFNTDDFQNVTTADLVDAMYGEIQSLIEQGSPENIAFHYFLPGIPFGPELASFMDLGPAPKPLENEGDAGEVRFTGNDVVRSAVNFARIVDHIPTVGQVLTKTSEGDDTAVVDLNALISSGRTVSTIYKSVLDNCKVINNSLSPEDEIRLKELRAKLFKPPVPEASAELEETAAEPEAADLSLDELLGDGLDTGDIVTDPSELGEPTPLMFAYQATRTAFEMVQAEQLQFASTITASNPNAGALLALSKQKIEAARKRWENLGQKELVESIQAQIEQLSLGGMPQYVSNLRRLLEANKMHAAVFATDEGATLLTEDAYYAALRPNGILRAPSFLKITIDSDHVETWKSMSSTSTSVKGAFLGLPLFATGKGKKVSEDSEQKFFSEGFSITFEIVQGLIDLPWCDLAFIESDAYTTVDPETKKPLDEVNEIIELSDGKRPPSGVMPIIPTTIYFARDVVVKSDALLTLSDTEKDTFNADAGISFFGFGASGDRMSKTTTVDTSRLDTEGEIRLDGLFIIAMASRFLEKAPNPDFESHPSSSDWI